MIFLKFLRFASPGKLASRLSTGKGSVGKRDVTWTPRDWECAPQKSQTSNKWELNWRVGDQSRAWGEGKLPLSMTQVYNGKWGVGRVTKLFAHDSFLSPRGPQKPAVYSHWRLQIKNW